MEQAEDAAALLRSLDLPGAWSAGIGFGALIALDLAVRHGPLVRAVVAADPPLYAFVPDANEELAEQRRVLQDSMATGGPDAAVEAWLAGRADAAALERAEGLAQGFFADYAGLASWPVTRAHLRSLAIPLSSSPRRRRRGTSGAPRTRSPAWCPGCSAARTATSRRRRRRWRDPGSWCPSSVRR